MLLSIFNRISDKLLIAQERRKQIVTSKATSISSSARVEFSHGSFCLSQTFSNVAPVALIVAWKNRILLRYPVAVEKYGRDGSIAKCRIPVSDLDPAYEQAISIDLNRASGGKASVHSEMQSANKLRHLQLGWTFSLRDRVPHRYINGYVEGRIMVPNNGDVSPLSDRAEVVCWAGSAAEVRVIGENRIPCNHGVAELRGNRFGKLVLVVGDAEITRVTPSVTSIDAQRHRVTVRGRVTVLTGAIDSADLVWKSHSDDSVVSGSAVLHFDEVWTCHDNGRKSYIFDATVSFASADLAAVVSNQFDAYLRVRDSYTHSRKDARLKCVPFFARLLYGTSTFSDGSRIISILPYFTFKLFALSVRVERFQKHAEPYLNPSRSLVRRIRHESRASAPIWLIGELPHRAQDNGLHFFRWLRRHHPEIDAYYVIEESSSDRSNLVGYTDHVVDHGSIMHFELALRAEKFVGTHHAEYLYPTRHPSFVRFLRGSRVFLQHGVMGTKWMVPNYGKRVPSFATDLIVTSSEYEKSYIMKDFGYKNKEVAVTGLPRFDRLFGTQSVVEPGHVLVMPTWRDWLRVSENFEATKYFQKWHGLLTSNQFLTILARHGLTVTLYLHPNMQKYSHLFEGIPGRVVNYGDEDVQSLLLRSACLITDYSSVAFDFSFQNRPVIYYQFDRDSFIGKYGSHIDLDRELPGHVCRESEEVSEHLHTLAVAHFKQPGELRARSQRFLDYRDSDNSARVYETILDAPQGGKHRRRRGSVETRAWVSERYSNTLLGMRALKRRIRDVLNWCTRRGAAPRSH